MEQRERQAERQHGSVYRFFRGLVVFLRNYFVMIGILATAAPILLAVLYGRLHREMSAPPSLDLTKENPAYLTLDLSGPVAEQEPDITELMLSRFLGGERQIYLPELRSALRRAAVDERVTRLELEIGALEGTPAEFAEIHRLVSDFREKGKPVTAVLNDASDWNYYVASAANRIVLNPASPIMVTGPLFTLIYFGEALRKIGVDIEVVRAGKYKSAFEPLVLDQPSEATIEQYQSMNRSLLEHVVETVAKGRGKTPDEVRAWYKQSIYTADEAVRLGIVDAVGYDAGGAALAATQSAPEGQPAPEVPAAPAAPSERAVTLSTYASGTANESTTQESADGDDGIALIEAVGEIGMSPSNSPKGEGISPLAMRKRIRWAAKAEDVKAVVLRVSSPGGSAIASDMIWHDLKMLAEAKPLVVSMGAYAASGGYYISAPARKIIAEPTTVTGSIGVIGMLPSFEAFKDKYGISFHVVSESDRRQMLNPGSKATGFDKALVEATIDQVYKTFLDRVAQGRNMKVEDVDALAQGRVYTGLEALKLGLVDEIGGLQAAFDAAKELAGLDVKKLYPVMRYDDDGLSLSDCFGSPTKMMRCLNDGGTTMRLFGRLGFGTVLSDVETYAERARAWIATAERERALALWPGYVGVRVR